MRVHENLTKLHNFTVNNRLKTTHTKEVDRRPNITNVRKSAEKQAYDYLKSKKRDKSGKRKSEQYSSNFN